MSDFQGIGELDSDLETLDGSLTTVAKNDRGFWERAKPFDASLRGD